MSNRGSSGFGLIIGVLFFISGATGLIYEVVWTRFFTIAYGNTTYGVSAVLTAFMGGLGLGSYVFGRFIDRKKDYLLIYAILEVFIALIALAMPWILYVLQGLYFTIYNWFPSSIWILQVVRTLLSFAILVVPTFLMGATLPVLTKFFVSRRSQVGTRIAILYSVNTLGATIGCFLTGFLLIKVFGLLHTVYIAAALNFMLAAAFLLLRRRFSTLQEKKEETKLDPAVSYEHEAGEVSLSPTRVKILLVCFAMAGFTSLAYEILWFRLLVFHLQTTIYAFTTMLTTFLGGIGLGSALFAAVQKKAGNTARNWENFGYVEAAIGLLGILSIVMFGYLDSLDTFLVEPFWKYVVIQFTAATLIMLLPTLLMGAAFPIVCKTLSEDVRKIGGSVGTVYAANTVGAIFGSFLTGFFLVRSIGTQKSLILMGILNLMIASVMLLSSPRRQGDAVSDDSQGFVQGTGLFRNPVNIGVIIGLWLIGVLSIMIIPKDFLFQYYNVREKHHSSEVEILHAEEGLESITTVHRYPDMTRVISAGSINVAGTSFTMRTTQMLQAHVPMLIHPNPRHVVQVGFGSGETAHLITTYDNVEQLDLVEISQSVLDTSSEYFRDINKDVVMHSKFNPIVMDGANYLRLTNKKYDVIMNDSIWPFYAGNSGLYTKDYFQSGKERLKEGGIMTSWLPLQIPLEDFEILLNTFHSVFPYVTVWVATTHFNKHALLIGSEKRTEIDIPTFLKRFKRYARSDLKLVKLDNPISFLSSFKMDEAGFEEEIHSSPIHTENKPILEFSMSRFSKGKTAGIQLRVYEFIHDHMTSLVPYLSKQKQDEHKDFVEKIRAAGEASGHVMMGLVKRERFEKDFIAEFEKALQLWPEDPLAAGLLAKVRQPLNIRPEILIGKSFEDLSALGYQLLKNQAFEDAYTVFKQMEVLRPGDVQIRATTGRILFYLERHEDAIEAFKTALSLSSTPEPDIVLDLSRAHHQYAMVLSTKGYLDKAEYHFTESIRLRPEVSGTHQNYGIFLAQHNRMQEAIAQFEEAVRLDPENVHAYVQLGNAMGRNGNIDAAIEYLEKAVAILPESWVAHKFLAHAYYLRKEYAKSWAEVQIVQKAGEESIDPRFLDILESASPQINEVKP